MHSGFRLEDGSIVFCRRLKDGWWEAWIERGGSPLATSDGQTLSFFGPTRFKAQCKAVRWYGSQTALCA